MEQTVKEELVGGVGDIARAAMARRYAHLGYRLPEIDWLMRSTVIDVQVVAGRVIVSGGLSQLNDGHLFACWSAAFAEFPRLAEYEPAQWIADASARMVADQVAGDWEIAKRVIGASVRGIEAIDMAPPAWVMQSQNAALRQHVLLELGELWRRGMSRERSAA